jgi:Na+-driven multidrug efflux pump
VLSVLFITLNWRIFWLFTQDDQAVLDYGKIIMPLTALIVFLQIAQVICAGALRGAGDTRYTAMVSLICIAIMRPVCGYLFCNIIGWGLIGAWISICFDQTVRLALYLPRVKKGNWTKIRL